MLRVEALNVFHGNLQALWDVSLAVEAGELVTLVGSNGAGKTTLLRAISGILKVASGTITFQDRPIGGLATHHICERGLIQVPEGRELFPHMTVLENLEIGAYAPSARKRRHESLEQVFARLPLLKERQKQLAGTLSGGEQQMLAIGRGLMARPRLLMLDEPTLGLAPILVQEIMRALDQINRDGMAVLLVSQEIHQALRLASRAYVLENGRIVRSGPADALLADQEVVQAYLGL